MLTAVMLVEAYTGARMCPTGLQGHVICCSGQYVGSSSPAAMVKATHTEARVTSMQGNARVWYLSVCVWRWHSADEKCFCIPQVTSDDDFNEFVWENEALSKKPWFCNVDKEM